VIVPRSYNYDIVIRDCNLKQENHGQLLACVVNVHCATTIFFTLISIKLGTQHGQ
jgi:hypothetical protein